ncbi:MAG: hypothetical protein GX612_10155 [Bacteroidales bacterium]|nr:hypothetical protein [Bacteroidales bacterium]OQA92446.1 MAG: hypothetical protein BWY27_00292 [Bacteroidetes bacterium ADurb.Bin234]
MKKLVLIVAASLAVVSFSACKKTCTCTPYALGVAGTAEEVELTKDFESCADMSTVAEIDGKKIGLECK